MEEQNPKQLTREELIDLRKFCVQISTDATMQFTRYGGLDAKETARQMEEFLTRDLLYPGEEQKDEDDS